MNPEKPIVDPPAVISTWRVDWKLLKAVGVAFLVIGAVPAWWFFTNPRFNRPVAATNACITNLKQIQGAVEQYAWENKLEATNQVSIADISGSANRMIGPLINRDLTCPKGGTYSITTVGEPPRCSHPGHALQ